MKSSNFNQEILKIKEEIQDLKLKIDKREDINTNEEIISLEKRVHSLNYNENSEALELVKKSRNQKRPTTRGLCEKIFKDFIELHGDGLYSDDSSIIGGIGILGDIPVTVIGHQKGRNVHENVRRNFGMAHPEGYRKALRLMREAELFGRPLITFIDTPGAYPGIEAEKRGQSRAIAQNLYALSGLKVPSISIVIGEGGSGGALALGITDRIFMFSNATYSVISPEGCATILWKDAGQAAKAAKHLSLSAESHLNSKIIDNIIEEPDFEKQDTYPEFIESLKKLLITTINSLSERPIDKLLMERYKKFRNIGYNQYL